MKSQGLYEEAIRECRSYFELRGDQVMSGVINDSYTLGGFHDAMNAIATKLISRRESSYVSPSNIALFFALSGDKVKSMDWLDRSYAEHESQLIYASIQPAFQEVRKEARFQELLVKMNFLAEE